MSTAFATQNNWILPLRDEEVEDCHIMDVRIMALESQFDREPAPVWEYMSTGFWLETFGDMTRAELADHARQIGLEIGSKATKPKLVAALVERYRELTGA